MRLPAILLGAVVLILALARTGVNGAEPHCRARLLPGVASVKPGTPFSVGVLLELDKGWHVYWKNPGESGTPTHVELTLPPGFSASAVDYPIPHRSEEPGGVVVYGFEESLLLRVTVTPPASLAAVGSVTIGANVAWLCCRETCIPGEAALSVSLPVGDGTGATGANAKTLDAWRDRFPVAPKDAGITCEGRVTESGNIDAKIGFPSDVTHVELFPAPDDAIEVKGARIEARGPREARVQLQARPYQGMKARNGPLEVLVAFTDSSGVRRGATLELPLAPAH